MTKDDLIEILHAEQELLDSGESKDYDKTYTSIRKNIKLFTKKNKSWNGRLAFPFCRFMDWKTVRKNLIFNINQRDARTIQFYIRDVDLRTDNYYIDDFGYLQNIDKDVLLQLIERLLESLEG